MGLCFSKKKSRTPPPPISPSSNSIAVEKKIGEKKKKKKQQQQQEIEPTTIPSSKSLSGKAAATVAAAAAAAAAATEKKPPVFVIMQNAAKNSAGQKEKKDRPEIESNGGGGIISATAAVDEGRPVPVRTSSCTKEEVDAILIQCGRLSRSSSGKAPSSDTTGGGGGHRRFSGSKRSFDFDHEKKLGEEELETAGESEKQLSRPSPRRRTPGRDRSGSRERATGGGSGGSRRVSRSPSRRSDGPASSSASAGERTKQPPLQQQPAKMVSVPAREKEAGVKRWSSPVKPKRCASPRSQSPANSARIVNENAGLNRAPQPGQPQSLSRSSSRKAENSPYRRNPMAEIDDNSNSLRGANQIGGANNYKVSKSPKKVDDDGVRKLNQTQSQKSTENNVAPRKSEIVEEALEAKGSSNSTTPNVIFETLNPRAVTQSRSSRRSSRDLDQNLGYTSLLLEDVQNYCHRQHNHATAFSLPACVSKACSILEAVADLNSSSSENDKGSLNGRFGKRGGSVPREPIFESEIVVKDDLMEPTLHKYVSVRDLGGGGVGGGGEMEPQESAGSNSFLGQPWAADSSWEPNSVDSTDQYSASQSINGEEEEVEQENGVNAGGRRSRGGSNGSNIVVAVNTSRKKREIGGDQQQHHHQQQQHHQQQRRLYRGGSSVSARSGTRALSVPVTAAAAQSSS